MARALIGSSEALDDIDSIADYISRDSIYQANPVVEDLLALADELLAHRRLGRIVPEPNDPNVRECFICSYRLIYEIKGSDIHLLGVTHGKRLLESVDRFQREDTKHWPRNRRL